MALEGLDVVDDYMARALPDLRLVFRAKPDRQLMANLTYEDQTGGKRYILEISENFYAGRKAGTILARLDAWNLAGEIRNGARRLRILEGSYQVIDRYR
jgi:hypothetical protein